MRFKVGDEVIITRLSEYAGYTAGQIAAYSKDIGGAFIIVEVRQGEVVLEKSGLDLWRFDEIELLKNNIVTNILNDL